MCRYLIELRCCRRPQTIMYDGAITIEQAHESAVQRLGTAFKNRDLRDVALDLHHAIRFVSGSQKEFSVTMVKEAKKSSDQSLSFKSSLTLEQIAQLHESPQSAQNFFNPLFYGDSPEAQKGATRCQPE